MSAFYLLLYLTLVFCYVKIKAKESHLQITLTIDSEYMKKAHHAAFYARYAEGNEILDAYSYFWESRK